MFEKQKNNENACLPEEISKTVNMKLPIASCALLALTLHLFQTPASCIKNAFSLLIIIII